MFKTIIQKWNAFKADWREYEKKNETAECALRKLERMEHRITGSYGNNDVKHCIEIKYVCMPSRIAVDELFGCASIKTAECIRYCPHFQHSKSLKKVGPCTEAACPWHEKNSQYVAAATEYIVAEEECRAAWRKLWQRAK